MRDRRTPGLLGFGLTIVVGSVLLGSAVVSMAGSTPVPMDAGRIPGVVAVSAPAVSVGSSAAPSSVELRAGAGPVVRSSATATSRSASGAPAVDARRAAARPAVLELPSLGVSAQVLPVRAVDGVLQVPDDPAQVGWWTGGARLGSTSGTIVLDGHIDSATRGIGALFRLGTIGPGDQVRVRPAAGPAVTYTVDARRVYPKTAGLPAEVFSREGPPRLVLISCGGTFDEQHRSYRDNIVVYATPDG